VALLLVKQNLNEKKELQDVEGGKTKQAATGKSSEIHVMVSKGIILLVLGIAVAIIIHLTIGL
jgi:hypothetical protein